MGVSLDVDRGWGEGKNEHMLPLMLALVMFGFLLAGSVMFIVCLLIQSARAFALSVALWFAAFGALLAGLILLSVVVLYGGTVIMDHLGPSPTSKLYAVASPYGPFLIGLALLASAVVASAVSWVHQKLIHRMTLALFRVYSAMVCAGMGSVFGWAGGIWLGGRGVDGSWVVFVLMMAVLVCGFGLLGWRSASALRGEAPASLTWITPEEFGGG